MEYKLLDSFKASLNGVLFESEPLADYVFGVVMTLEERFGVYSNSKVVKFFKELGEFNYSEYSDFNYNDLASSLIDLFYSCDSLDEVARKLLDYDYVETYLGKGEDYEALLLALFRDLGTDKTLSVLNDSSLVETRRVLYFHDYTSFMEFLKQSCVNNDLMNDVLEDMFDRDILDSCLTDSFGRLTNQGESVCKLLDYDVEFDSDEDCYMVLFMEKDTLD